MNMDTEPNGMMTFVAVHGTVFVGVMEQHEVPNKSEREARREVGQHSEYEAHLPTNNSYNGSTAPRKPASWRPR
jgi:hypothetical protein